MALYVLEIQLEHYSSKDYNSTILHCLTAKWKWWQKVWQIFSTSICIWKSFVLDGQSKSAIFRWFRAQFCYIWVYSKWDFAPIRYNGWNMDPLLHTWVQEALNWVVWNERKESIILRKEKIHNRVLCRIIGSFEQRN